MATELREAKVTVRIATDDALKELDRLDAETKARREAVGAEEKRRREDSARRPDRADDARTTDEKATGPRATTPARDAGERAAERDGEPASGFRRFGREATSRGRQFVDGPGTAARALGLELVGAIPVAGPVIRGGLSAADFSARYGPAAMQALRPLVPAAAQPMFDEVLAGARSGARFVDSLRAKLTAVDTTFEQVRAMAVTQRVWGVNVDSGVLAASARRLYAVNYALDRHRMVKESIGRELGGAALGDILGSAVRDAFAEGGR